MRRELGKVELAQALTNEHFPFNAVVALRFSRPPRPQVMGEVLDHLQRRHPLLAVRILKENKGFFFDSQGVSAIPFQALPRQDGDHWRQVVESELNETLDYVKGPLLKVIFLTPLERDGEGDLIFNFHHAIVDATSATQLLGECLDLCARLEEGESLESIPCSHLLPPAEAFFPPSSKRIRGGVRILRFMLGQIKDEIGYRLHTRGARKAPIHTHGRGKILNFILPRELTATLLKESRRRRITLNNLLSAVILQAVQKELYQGESLPLRHFSFADLRPYLKPPVGRDKLGSYFSMMRFTVNMEKEIGIWELAAKIGDLTYTSQKKGEKFDAYLTSSGMMSTLLKMRSFRMGTTAVSYTGPVLLEKGYGPIQLEDIHVFTSNFVLGPEYTAQVRLFDHRLYWDILYLDSDMDQVRAETIAVQIRTYLEKAIEGGCL